MPHARRTHTAIAACIAATLAATHSAGAFTISGQWSYDPASSTYTLPSTPSPADFEQFLLQALPSYPGASNILAGLTGDAIVAVDSLTFRVYDSPDGTGTFGELGGDVQFNPLATGGTADISTGGQFVDKQLNQQKEQFEVAQQDVENHVFKQQFGQVQSNKHKKAGGTLESIFISFRGPITLPPGALDVDASNLTQPFDATLSVVPTAPTAALLIPGAALLARRRR